MDKHFILHLTLINDIGPGIIQRIIQKRSEFKSSDLYLFSASDWMHTFGFTELAAQKLSDGLQNKKSFDYELSLIERHNIQWATVEDDTYPALLREIYLPPSVLYWQGLPSSVHPDPSIHHLRDTQGERQYRREKKLAIVGARKADGYGQRVIDALVPDLVAAQYTIVSGGARGIDTMAHEATLKNGGKTIAVLGSGLLNVYPISNTKLFQSIVDQGGLVVSAFPLTMEGFPGNFPARNRIISGLSRGCLVVQAAKKSGALISADYAMEQGREVFAVPGPFDSELSLGCNALIQKGAKLVMTSNDILEEFGDRIIIPDLRVTEHKAQQLSLESMIIAPIKNVEFNSSSVRYGSTGSPRTVIMSSVRPELVEGNERSCYSDLQKKIINACMQPSYFDTIVTGTQLTSEIVQSELFNLQLDGVVSQDFTGMWITSKI